MSDHQGWLTPRVCQMLAQRLHNVRDRAAFRLVCRVCARSVVLMDGARDAYPIFGWTEPAGKLMWRGRYTDGFTIEYENGKTDCHLVIHCPVWLIAMEDVLGIGVATRLVIREIEAFERPRISYQFSAAVSPVGNVTVSYVYDAIYLGTKTLHRYLNAPMVAADKKNLMQELAEFPTIFASVKDYLVVYLYTDEYHGDYVIIHKQDYAGLMEELAELSSMLEHESRARMRAHVSKVRQGLL